jgi:putative N-acetyltransferase (TIGR04045 family)
VPRIDAPPAPEPRLAAGARCRLARDADDLAAHHAVRRLVFVDEQALFVGDDRDERDGADGTLHVVGVVDGAVGGAVRLYPLENGSWKGDRLAVLPEHRHGRMGVLLVRYAVRAAGARGGREMVAHVQLPNVRFFEWLGWRPRGRPEPFHGAVHQLMAIPLRRGGRAR